MNRFGALGRWILIVGFAAHMTACGQTAMNENTATKGEPPLRVRNPAVAGGFYPADPQELSRFVENLIRDAQIPVLHGRVRVLIAPHAGYVYSGKVAAHAFKAIQGRSYSTVVVMGNSHREGYRGAAVYARGIFRTPLGDVPVDEAFARRLMEAEPLIFERDSAHLFEHSLEVEVPFLQKALGNFKIVPLLLGTETMDVAQAVGKALARVADDATLVVVSTDLSHYPAYDDAVFADKKTLEAVTSGDVETLDRTLRHLESLRIPNMATLMCAEGAVKAGLTFANAVGATQAVVLAYANSGDAKIGTRDGVVGYGAVAFLASSGETGRSPEQTAVEQPSLSVPRETEEGWLGAEEQQAVLDLAKLTVETYVRTGKKPVWTNSWPALNEPRGAFVTLKKRGVLRGCIGRFEPTQPLWEVVMEMAIAAATQDVRFPPVRADELKELEYEVSVLSPLRKVKSWREIQYGRHGVQVVRGWRRGVFLPQVATETGWDFETFMNNLCAHKAGLPADAWKDPATEIYVFTAQIIGASHGH